MNRACCRRRRRRRRHLRLRRHRRRCIQVVVRPQLLLRRWLSDLMLDCCQTRWSRALWEGVS